MYERGSTVIQLAKRARLSIKLKQGNVISFIPVTIVHIKQENFHREACYSLAEPDLPDKLLLFTLTIEFRVC